MFPQVRHSSIHRWHMIVKLIRDPKTSSLPSVSFRRNVMPSSHIHLGPISFGLPIKILHAFIFSPMRATCPTQLIHLNFISPTIFGKNYTSWAPHCAFFSNIQLIHPPPLLYPSVFLTNLFSNILSQGCTNPGNQVARATKFFVVATRALRPRYGTCFVSPFWCREFWSSS
jgi:hypothetical protein